MKHFQRQKKLFQSTLPRGERLFTASKSVADLLFQSTLPRGERLDSPDFLRARARCFNPRSRAGSDILGFGNQRKGRCFNPRSRAGSDNLRAPEIKASILFQSTLPRGERQEVRQWVTMATGFNPRSRAGSDEIDHTRPQGLSVSIHAPARGATPLLITY